MKKILLILLVITLALMTAACAGETTSQTEATQQPQSQLHTIAATDETSDEINWAYLDDSMTLEDSKGEKILSDSDFECFALVGSGDDAKIVFRFTDDAVKLLKSLPDDSYMVKKDDNEIGVLYALDGNTAALKCDRDSEGMMRLADLLRGFE